MLRLIGGIGTVRARSCSRRTSSPLLTGPRGLAACLAPDLCCTLLLFLLCCVDRAGVVRGAWSVSQPARLLRVGAWPARASPIACNRGAFTGGESRSLLALEGWCSSGDVVEGGGEGGAEGRASLGLTGRRCGCSGSSSSGGGNNGGGLTEKGGIWMKANKKNKRKREERQGESGAGASSSGAGAGAGGGGGAVPQRVSSDAPVSVRTQIRYAKMRKSLQKAPPGSGKKIPNAYRRVKSLDYEDIVEPEDLSQVYMPDIAPSLMVDGYNIIFHWSKCCLMADGGDMEGARRLLVEELDTLSAMRGWAVTVVFDAYKRKAKSNRGYTTANKIEVVYTTNGESADMYVERHTEELKDAGCPNVMVATGDKLMQSLVVGAGAEVFSPDRIIEEIQICHREAKEYTSMYLRRKEKAMEASDMEDLLSSVRYVEKKAKLRKTGGAGGRSGRGGRGGRGSKPTFNIEDDL